MTEQPSALHFASLFQALDRWEERLEALFEGRPYDILDAALTDTISKFPLHIQPFRDMIDGMRLDLSKLRYKTFDELYGYCYMVAGTVALMSTPVMGIDPSYKVYCPSVNLFFPPSYSDVFLIFFIPFSLLH